MKVGDLVTLSTYALQSAPLAKWRITTWEDRKPLAGIVVEVRESKYIRAWTSDNERKLFIVRWISSDGPGGRWGLSYRFEQDGFFYRNDLKHLKKTKNKNCGRL